MNELQSKNTFTSLELTELINKFRKEEGIKNKLEHKDLLKIIRLEFEEEIGEGKISPTSYKDQWNREQPMFILNLQQSRQVLVRESKFVRKAVIKYIDELENKLRGQFQVPTSFAEALRLAAEQQEKIEKLALDNKVKDQQISELQPKASYYDLILQCKDLLSMTVIAKDYGKSAEWMNKKLHQLGVQFKQSGVWLLYQKYADKGYTQTKTQNYPKTDGTQGVKIHMYWSQKGRLFLYNLLKNNGIMPIVEMEGTENDRKRNG
ncbi:phage regulatory protein/antirepressor Ant [Fusobacterium necrophorum]|uniref:phage antirepressor KilAC domain-containing protein n=1 Tax=Fusobacterium necrophorum TaxID=859 RepID=UPI00254AC5BE|nr:phage antirepressor KilAC domain-containing protein [Fusobacterium necrophorum]MDK4495288.1 phage regulatory protein/antirepressor Ant [Fusobacterium necrophorum]MDK4509341.1 phage regulatory protein/antirepressor Ant [Fusobacterium necrophorum]